jgi:hypothetical protein
VTLLYDAAAHVGAGTHVLAIGVGKYPHLIDGKGQLAANPLGLGQLQSPPVSTKAFVDFCLAPLIKPDAIGFINAAAPLASIDVLISAESVMTIQAPDGPKPIDPATLANIQAAFAAWLVRVATNPNNVGVLYYCGHGFMVSERFLLAEDFGQDHNQPWEHAFDITKTLRAVERDVRGAVYFLVDACRVFSSDVALSLGADPRALKAVDLKKSVICTSTALIEATGEGQKAFAATGGQVSRFTSALVTAMSGYCGIKAAGSPTWDVDGEALAAAVRKLLDRASAAFTGRRADERQTSQQTVAGASVPLLRRAFEPKVQVQLGLTPDKKRSLYELYLQPERGVRIVQDRPTGVFEKIVPRGNYEVGARDQIGALGHITHPNEELIPPVYGLTIEAPI